MPSSSLQGLDVIHSTHQESSNASRDLLGQAYPDLSAQLDLWNSLEFDSDDPIAPENNEHKDSLHLLAEEEEEEARSPVTQEKAIRDGHANVVTPTNVINPNLHQIQNGAALINPATAAAQSFDLNALLAGFGLDPFAVAAVAAAAPSQHVPQLQQAQSHPQVIAPSLAQLLAMHSVHNVGYPPQGFLPYQLPSVNPSPATPAPSSFPRNVPIVSSTSEESYGSTKRARTRRSSITVDSPEDGSPTASVTPNVVDDGSSPGLTPLSAAEDKRRRNTAASARFRLKKKEREAALETKSKELETKVVELERECEALRRENGWLKGLVVGVTGAAAQAPSGQGHAAPSGSTGTKRSREEVGSA